jgi:hypothetical protein
MVFAMAAQRFEAVVEAEDDRLFVEVPAAVVAALGPRRRPPLVIEVNGYRYRSTPAVYRGRTYLGFRRDIREAAGLSAGRRVAVSLELDEQPREVAVPNDLEDALRADPTAQAAFAALSFTHRKEYVEWVESAKRDETRRRRIERTVTILRPGPKDT